MSSTSEDMRLLSRKFEKTFITEVARYASKYLDSDSGNETEDGAGTNEEAQLEAYPGRIKATAVRSSPLSRSSLFLPTAVKGHLKKITVSPVGLSPISPGARGVVGPFVESNVLPGERVSRTPFVDSDDKAADDEVAAGCFEERSSEDELQCIMRNGPTLLSQQTSAGRRLLFESPTPIAKSKRKWSLPDYDSREDAEIQEFTFPPSLTKTSSFGTCTSQSDGKLNIAAMATNSNQCSPSPPQFSSSPPVDALVARVERPQPPPPVPVASTDLTTSTGAAFTFTSSSSSPNRSSSPHPALCPSSLSRHAAEMLGYVYLLEAGSAAHEVSPRKRHCLDPASVVAGVKSRHQWGVLSRGRGGMASPERCRGSHSRSSRPCLDFDKMREKPRYAKTIQVKCWDSPHRVPHSYNPGAFKFQTISAPYCPLTPVAGL